jgi:hypothetical protein
MLYLMKALGKELIITPGVKDEIVNHPIQTKRFMLKGMRLQELIKEGTIKVMSHPELKEETFRIASTANKLLSMGKRTINVVHEGEAESIALYELIDADALLVDERTTRHLIESPEKVRDYMQSRVEHKVDLNLKVADALKKEMKSIKVIRSSEIIAFAYENGILKSCETKESLEAALFALKFSGCSITEEEIKEYLEMLG